MQSFHVEVSLSGLLDNFKFGQDAKSDQLEDDRKPGIAPIESKKALKRGRPLGAKKLPEKPDPDQLTMTEYVRSQLSRKAGVF